MNEDIRKLIDSTGEGEDGNESVIDSADAFVKETIRSCRLFTEPADTVKYYGENRRDQWNDDSDEIMLLCQFFNNALVSGDPGSVEIARAGFEQLTIGDDEMLYDVIESVLLRHLDHEEIIALFDPEKQSETKRYSLAVTASIHPDILTEERRDIIFDNLKKRVKTMLKDYSPEARAVFDEALILGEFGDSRAIPVLRRYVALLQEPSEAQFAAYEERAKNGEKIKPKEELTPAMMMWEICGEIESLGGSADDIKANNPFEHLTYDV